MNVINLKPVDKLIQGATQASAHKAIYSAAYGALLDLIWSENILCGWLSYELQISTMEKYYESNITI